MAVLIRIITFRISTLARQTHATAHRQQTIARCFQALDQLIRSAYSREIAQHSQWSFSRPAIRQVAAYPLRLISPPLADRQRNRSPVPEIRSHFSPPWLSAPLRDKRACRSQSTMNKGEPLVRQSHYSSNNLTS